MLHVYKRYFFTKNASLTTHVILCIIVMERVAYALYKNSIHAVLAGGVQPQKRRLHLGTKPS